MEKRVLFLDTAHPFLAEELEKMGFECTHYHGNDRQAILSVIGDFDGIVIRSKIKLDRQVLQEAHRLKFIGRVGAGMENIDVPYAVSRGIRCLNAPEGNRDAVGEHAIGMLLALNNYLCRANLQVRNGIWIREGNRGSEIQGKTIGIIGYGNMGSAFAEKLRGFGVRIIAYDKYLSGFGNQFVHEVQMEAIFRETDILSLHVPLTEETHHLVDKTYLKSFEKRIILINTARGQCVKTADLLDAIDAGAVAGAALDVLEYENMSFENLNAEDLPPDFKRLIECEKILLSPHIAGWTHESNRKMAVTLVQKIADHYGKQFR